MKEIFTPKTIRSCDIFAKNHKFGKCGDKCLLALDLKIWNQLPSNVKSLTSISKFKEYIRTWFGPSSKCNICRMI